MIPVDRHSLPPASSGVAHSHQNEVSPFYSAGLQHRPLHETQLQGQPSPTTRKLRDQDEVLKNITRDQPLRRQYGTQRQEMDQITPSKRKEFRYDFNTPLEAPTQPSSMQKAPFGISALKSVHEDTTSPSNDSPHHVASWYQRVLTSQTLQKNIIAIQPPEASPSAKKASRYTYILKRPPLRIAPIPIQSFAEASKLEKARITEQVQEELQRTQRSRFKVEKKITKGPRMRRTKVTLVHRNVNAIHRDQEEVLDHVVDSVMTNVEDVSQLDYLSKQELESALYKRKADIVKPVDADEQIQTRANEAQEESKGGHYYQLNPLFRRKRDNRYDKEELLVVDVEYTRGSAAKMSVEVHNVDEEYALDEEACPILNNEIRHTLDFFLQTDLTNYAHQDIQEGDVQDRELSVYVLRRQVAPIPSIMESNARAVAANMLMLEDQKTSIDVWRLARSGEPELESIHDLEATTVAVLEQMQHSQQVVLESTGEETQTLVLVPSEISLIEEVEQKLPAVSRAIKTVQVYLPLEVQRSDVLDVPELFRNIITGNSAGMEIPNLSQEQVSLQIDKKWRHDITKMVQQVLPSQTVEYKNKDLTMREVKRKLLLDHPKRLTEMSFNTLDAPYIDQGDVDVYSPSSVLERQEQRRDQDISDILWKFWKLSVLDKAEYISLPCYAGLQWMISLCLQPHWQNTKRTVVIVSDQYRDCMRNSKLVKGEIFLHKSSFLNGLYELADIWVSTVVKQDYVQFLSFLYNGVVQNIVSIEKKKQKKVHKPRIKSNSSKVGQKLKVAKEVVQRNRIWKNGRLVDAPLIPAVTHDIYNDTSNVSVPSNQTREEIYVRLSRVKAIVKEEGKISTHSKYLWFLRDFWFTHPLDKELQTVWGDGEIENKLMYSQFRTWRKERDARRLLLAERGTWAGLPKQKVRYNKDAQFHKVEEGDAFIYSHEEYQPHLLHAENDPITHKKVTSRGRTCRFVNVPTVYFGDVYDRKDRMKYLISSVRKSLDDDNTRESMSRNDISSITNDITTNDMTPNNASKPLSDTFTRRYFQQKLQKQFILSDTTPLAAPSNDKKPSTRPMSAILQPSKQSHPEVYKKSDYNNNNHHDDTISSDEEAEDASIPNDSRYTASLLLPSSALHSVHKPRPMSATLMKQHQIHPSVRHKQVVRPSTAMPTVRTIASQKQQVTRPYSAHNILPKSTHNTTALYSKEYVGTSIGQDISNRIHQRPYSAAIPLHVQKSMNRYKLPPSTPDTTSTSTKNTRMGVLKFE